MSLIIEQIELPKLYPSVEECAKFLYEHSPDYIVNGEISLEKICSDFQCEPWFAEKIIRAYRGLGIPDLPLFLKMFRSRYRRKANARIIILGPNRSGKSTFSMTLGNLISRYVTHKPFSHENVCFDTEVYLEKLQNSKPGDIVIADEIGAFEGGGQYDYQTIAGKLLRMTEIISGKKQVFAVMCVPFFDLTQKSLRTLCDYAFRVVPSGEDLRTAAFYTLSTNVFTSEVFRKLRGIYFFGKAFRDRPEEWKAYEDMKDSFMNGVFDMVRRKLAEEKEKLKEGSEGLTFDDLIGAIEQELPRVLNNKGKISQELIMNELHCGQLLARRVKASIEKKQNREVFEIKKEEAKSQGKEEANNAIKLSGI